MTLVSGIVVYIMLWWLIFFMVLPVGVRAQHEDGEGVVPGTTESAPVKPHLFRKALAATLLAGIFFAGYYYVERNDWFGLFGSYFDVSPAQDIETRAQPMP